MRLGEQIEKTNIKKEDLQKFVDKWNNRNKEIERRKKWYYQTHKV